MSGGLRWVSERLRTKKKGSSATKEVSCGMQGSTTRSLVRSCPAYAAKFSRQVKTRNKTRNILLCVLCAGKINCDMVDKNYSTPRAGIQSSCILPSVSINLIASTFLVFFVNSFVCIPLLLPSHSHHPQKFMRAQTPL